MKDFYYTVHEWMFKDLKLSGSELIIYAVIYRYANVENQYFTMTIRSLAEHLNLSNATVQKCINSLVEKDLILKKQSMHENGIGLKNAYAINFDVFQKVEQRVPESRTQENNKNNKNNKYNNTRQLDNKNNIPNSNIANKLGGIRGVRAKTSKENNFSRFDKQLDAFLLENFSTKTERVRLKPCLNLYLKYRLKFKLEPEQWQAILNSIKGRSFTEIHTRVQTALAGGYRVLVPVWELQRKDKPIDNIQQTPEDDGLDHTIIDKVY